jgi:hypothetical protein
MVAICHFWTVKPMLARRFKFGDLQLEIQGRREALAGLSVALPTDESLRNKGGRRTPEKQQLLRRMDQSARAAGLAPILRYI